MTPSLRLPATLLAGFLLAACGRSEAPPATVQHDAKAGDHGAAAEIAWFPGTVEEAFAAAKEQGKPIFLYWGAVWCPPCHEIKATVFRSREFIERSRLFVPVYLDGDSENAQALGEKFGVVGYPTMIVFSPAGEEITRIPGGIDIQAYANVLDLTLAQAQPVSALLAKVLDEGASLDASQCRLLAYYSWGQDKSLLADRDDAAAFRAMAGACPAAATTERSMLQMAALEAAVDAAGQPENAVAMTAEQKAEALQQVRQVLADKGLTRANLFTIIGAGTDITTTITDAGSAERADLQARFVEVLKRMQDDPSLFTTERLYGTLGLLDFARVDDPEAPLPPELVEDVRVRVQKADAGTTDTSGRPSSTLRPTCWRRRVSRKRRSSCCWPSWTSRSSPTTSWSDWPTWRSRPATRRLRSTGCSVPMAPRPVPPRASSGGPTTSTGCSRWRRTMWRGSGPRPSTWCGSWKRAGPSTSARRPSSSGWRRSSKPGAPRRNAARAWPASARTCWRSAAPSPPASLPAPPARASSADVIRCRAGGFGVIGTWCQVRAPERDSNNPESPGPAP